MTCAICPKRNDILTQRKQSSSLSIFGRILTLPVFWAKEIWLTVMSLNDLRQSPVRFIAERVDSDAMTFLEPCAESVKAWRLALLKICHRSKVFHDVTSMDYAISLRVTRTRRIIVVERFQLVERESLLLIFSKFVSRAFASASNFASRCSNSASLCMTRTPSSFAEALAVGVVYDAAFT